MIDVRSRPFMRFAPEYNRGALEAALRERGMTYEFMGDDLGQRPHEDRFYDAEGHTLYDVIAAEPSFERAIERLEREAPSRRIALTCVEEEPERCHRYHLIGRVLQRRGVGVEHIRRDGTIETQEEVGRRIGEDQTALFERPWRSPFPMQGGHGRGPSDAEDLG